MNYQTQQIIDAMAAMMLVTMGVRVNTSVMAQMDNQSLAPTPRFLAHSTSSQEQILSSGYIQPSKSGSEQEGQYVPLSLDGIWGRYLGDPYAFIFDISVVKSLRIKPVFFLGTTGLIYTMFYDEFTVMDYHAIWCAEVKVIDRIPVSRENLVKMASLPETPLHLYLDRLVPKLKQESRKVIVKEHNRGYSWLIPSLREGAIVTGYNLMVARTFSVDYSWVLSKVEESIECGKAPWIKWW